MAFRKFIFMPIPICREWKKKKKKLETEDKSNGNPLLHHFFPPHYNFTMKTQKYSLLYFFHALLVFLEKWMEKKREKKKNSKFEREDKSNGNPLLNHLIFFVPLQFSYENSETFPAVYFLCPVSICRIMNAKKKKKTQNSSQKTRDHWFFFFSFTTFSLLFIFLVVT